MTICEQGTLSLYFKDGIRHKILMARTPRSKDGIEMRLGVNIEYDGKCYDILELPKEAFLHLIPGLTNEQYRKILNCFEDYWPEPTLCRNHVISFAAGILGESIDSLFVNRDALDFDDRDLLRYIEQHTKLGNRPS